MITPNRIVAFLTPVFAGLSAWFVQWVATTLPGHPHLDGAEFTVLMGLGAAAGVAPAISWLHGWQKHEGRTTAPWPVKPPVVAAPVVAAPPAPPAA